MTERTTQAISIKMLNGLKPKPDGEYTVWDTKTSGFGVRVRPTGSKTFILQYRNERGRQRKLTIGSHRKLTLEQARKVAKMAMGQAVSGVDPAEAKISKRNVLTMSELCDRYLEDAKAGRIIYRGKAKSSNTIEIDEGRIERHIKPMLGNRSIEEITIQDMQNFLFDIAEGKTKANIKTRARGRARVTGGMGTAKKALSLASSIFNYAMKQGLLPDNPCRLVERPADGKRERFLSASEYARFGAALYEMERMNLNANGVRVLRTLALTGCRSAEIRTLKKEMVDLEAGCFRFPHTKTGSQIRPAGQVALNYVSVISAAQSNDWVFPAGKGSGCIQNIRKPMLKACEIAGLSDVTPHTLRHSFATVAHELGYSELTIAGLLGHQLNSVTSRYAHHVDSALREAADRVAGEIANRMKWNER